MCRFFSFVSDGNGKYWYTDWEQRKKLDFDGNCDSHSRIAERAGFTGEREDRLNKYEFNPFSGEFRVDAINVEDDRVEAEDWVRNVLDFRKVVEPLRLHPIVHPFKDVKKKKVSKKDIENLKKWDSAGFHSVWDSVWDYARDSVRGSVGESVRGSVGFHSVGDSVLGSVRGSVGDSVRGSVWGFVEGFVGGSMRISVWDFVWAYCSSFFQLDKWKGVNPFQCGIDLWNRGFVPSFDGEVWRLHQGVNAEVVYEITKEELRK